MMMLSTALRTSRSRHVALVPSTRANNFSSQPRRNEQGEEIVTFLTLNNLQDNPGAAKKKRRVGRGVGSSKGKTCGRGMKGQKARSKVHPTFEGGQTKLYKRLPKRGFNNKVHAEPMLPINIGRLQDFVDMKRLIPRDDPPLNMKDFLEAGVVTTTNSIKHGVKLLAKGRLATPLNLEVSRASASAIAAVEEAGGTITTVHYNRLALRALLKPHKFEIIPKRALPPPRLMPYYTNWKHRGYLSPQAQLRKLLKDRPELEEKLTMAVDNSEAAAETNSNEQPDKATETEQLLEEEPLEQKEEERDSESPKEAQETEQEEDKKE